MLAGHHPLAVAGVAALAERSPRAPTAAPPSPAGTADRCRRRPGTARSRRGVPTLPTPTTLRARCDEPELLEQRPAVGLQRAAVAAHELAQHARSSASARDLGNSSSTGSISGGSLMMRGSPSTTCVSFENACMLSRVRALARLRLDRLHPLRLELRCAAARARRRRRGGRTRPPGWASSRTRRMRLAVLAHAWRGRPRSHCCGREAVVAAGHDQAGRQPLDVPLPRPRQRLVEVVDVEHQPALGRGERRRSWRGGRRRTACTRMPESGVPARSAAITSAAPR